MSLASDERWMALAIEEAKAGLGQCSPNPAVGAVIVKAGQVIGRGYHPRAGEPHAERFALADARRHHASALAGATIYVTLEPCSTRGRTPPCTEGIIEAGIQRVVYASTDPNPRHLGGAKALLESRGIDVCSGILEREADALIRGFRMAQTQGRPWVISKLGMSLDGRLSRPPGEDQWLTSPSSKKRVQEIRSTVDAILIGGNTLRRDNPRLNLRDPRFAGRRQPLRVVLCRDRSRLPADSTLFQDEHADRSLILEGLSPAEALRQLQSEHGINTVLLEAGTRLQGAFFDADLVDEVHYFYAPLLCGGPDSAIGGGGVESLAAGLRLTEATWKRLEDDLELHALVKHEPESCHA